jgi:3-hydroxyisobutyrate dehydrogenase-like beta-hydroxyacid dehydrogenase
MFNEIERVGFGGLGAMGGGIAQRLLDAAYEVVGWSRTARRGRV